MRKLILFLISIVIMSLFVFQSCKQKGDTTHNKVSTVPFVSVQIAPFFKSYPELKKYEKELVVIYRNYDFSYIWFDQKGIVEYGDSLYNKVINIEDEGVYSTFPYQKEIDILFNENTEITKRNLNTELLLTSLYLFYVDKVYKGIDHETTTDIGWLLPCKKRDYTVLLDSIISGQKLGRKDSLNLFKQYYLLRNALNRYQTINKNGGWSPIESEPDYKSYIFNDTSKVIQQIRNRLYVTGEIKQNNKSNIYDAELLAGIRAFQLHNGYKPDSLISAEHIEAMNITVGEYIKKIVVNMERCRWVPPQVSKAKEFVFVNIHSYKVRLFRDGKIEFDSPVVVGSVMTKTVIFDGKMSYIAFSPYWNLPKSIIKNEVIPGIEKDKDYLENHNMEWNDGKVRQLPGKNNSLGLVKFMFPNSNDIYLHDTPAKSLFKRENRAISHGCIRVEKARELAITILKGDENWTVEKIDSVMNAGKESIYTLKNKIPVYIGYFTAWVDRQGQINFYKDVYKRDERLAELLFYK